MSSPPVQTQPAKKFGDEQMETIMGRLLQAGVLLASSFVLVGGVLYLHAHAASKPDYRSFSSEPATLRRMGNLAHGILSADPAAIIQLGVLLLIATPIARVIFALVAFTLEGDKLYIVVSMTVLTVLLFGFFHSR